MEDRRRRQEEAEFLLNEYKAALDVAEERVRVHERARAASELDNIRLRAEHEKLMFRYMEIRRAFESQQVLLQHLQRANMSNLHLVHGAFGGGNMTPGSPGRAPRGSPAGAAGHPPGSPVGAAGPAPPFGGFRLSPDRPIAKRLRPRHQGNK